jgi:hypothetical protein
VSLLRKSLKPRVGLRGPARPRCRRTNYGLALVAFARKSGRGEHVAGIDDTRKKSLRGVGRSHLCVRNPDRTFGQCRGIVPSTRMLGKGGG